MARKSLGYTELHWTCPNCNGENPGEVETCNQCGAPQPDNVEFHQATHRELITDEAKLERAKAGPDIHCGYCGTRNPAGAETCSQCNADLSEGARREAGQVVGAFSEGDTSPIPCPHCAAENPSNALICAVCGGSLAPEPERPKPAAAVPAPAPRKQPNRLGQVILIVGALFICGLLALFVLLSGRTEATTGQVSGVFWERSIVVEEFLPVEYQTWEDQIPAEGQILGCQEELRSVQAEEVPNAREICGTPYEVDTGSGFAEVVQDCEYHVYDDYCSFTVQEWIEVEVATVSGENFAPAWPAPALAAGQRLGQQSSERYVCIFDAGGEVYQYATNDIDTFQRCEIGSRWDLNVNAFGSVISIEQ